MLNAGDTKTNKEPLILGGVGEDSRREQGETAKQLTVV